MENARIGLIGGTGSIYPDFLGEPREITIETAYGEVDALEGEGFLFIERHGLKTKVPAHRVNHRANITAFKNSGITRVIGISSAGSMKEDIPPGSLVVPDDFIQLAGIPTFFDTERVHVTPALDGALRDRIIRAAEKEGINVIRSGTYLQNSGPRFETRAEIRFMREYADLVGMTMASEATLACELDIRYACMASVDNYAHGVCDEEPEFDHILAASTKNVKNIKTILRSIIINK